MNNKNGFRSALAQQLGAHIRGAAVGLAQQAVTDWAGAKRRVQAFANGAALILNNTLAFVLTLIALVGFGLKFLDYFGGLALGAVAESIGMAPAGTGAAIVGTGGFIGALIALVIYFGFIILIFGYLRPLGKKLANVVAPPPVMETIPAPQGADDE